MMLPSYMEPLFMASLNMVKTMPFIIPHPLKMLFNDGDFDYGTAFEDWPPKLDVQHFAFNDTPLTPPTTFIQYVGGWHFCIQFGISVTWSWLLLYLLLQWLQKWSSHQRLCLQQCSFNSFNNSYPACMGGIAILSLLWDFCCVVLAAIWSVWIDFEDADKGKLCIFIMCLIHKSLF